MGIARKAWLVCFLCLWAGRVLAQRDTTLSRDSIQQLYYLQEQQRAREADTVRIRKDGFYRKAKELSKRKRMMGEVYRFLFREPDNPLRVRPKKSENLDKRYRRFDGRVIRHIRVQALDVFGAKVYDTTALPKNVFEKLGNGLHATTRPFVIRGQLSFREGDRFNSAQIANNERVLRQRGYLVDARILPQPTGYRDSVDLLVVTQDIFTLSGGVSPSAVDNIAFDVQERNFLGLNHTLALKYEYFGRANPHQVNNYRVYYFVPYLHPRTFVSAEAEAYWYYNRHTLRTRVFKDFLFTTTRNAGSAELRVSEYAVPYFAGDSIARYRIEEDVADVWYGRAVPLKFGFDVDEAPNLVFSGRAMHTRYRNRPFVSVDSNQIFRDRQLGLGAISYSRRDYFRDVLINGYGRTEDVPYGCLLSGIGGVEHNPDGWRPYIGGKYGFSRFLGNAGYMNLAAEAGTYLNRGRPEQGALRVDALYFSPILPLGRAHFRQFFRMRFVQGYNRFYSEFLSIASDNGIRGASSAAFDGQRSLVFNLETVAFVNFDLLSFKAAPFILCDLGWAARAREILLDRSPFVGVGGGLRLYNERLTFSNIELRLSYYPNVPDLSTPFKANFARGTSLRLQDFAVTAPDVVRFQ